MPVMLPFFGSAPVKHCERPVLGLAPYEGAVRTPEKHEPSTVGGNPTTQDKTAHDPPQDTNTRLPATHQRVARAVWPLARAHGENTRTLCGWRNIRKSCGWRIIRRSCGPWPDEYASLERSAPRRVAVLGRPYHAIVSIPSDMMMELACGVFKCP